MIREFLQRRRARKERDRFAAQCAAMMRRGESGMVVMPAISIRPQDIEIGGMPR
jgi:hypothetical protein